MKRLLLLSFAFALSGCGFKLALGVNRFKAPLSPLVITDTGGQQVGDVLRRHLPGALARAGLNRGDGKGRKLSISIGPWRRVSLYNSIDGRTVVFGEQFVVTLSAKVEGDSRLYSASSVVVLAPANSLQQRALNLRRVAEQAGYQLAYKIAEALE
jgi:outer membrane lipopolysaccharide assembly protein LptE/RlpB